jgi:hypothetical protein
VALGRLRFWQAELNDAIERGDREQIARCRIFVDEYEIVLSALAPRLDLSTSVA